MVLDHFIRRTASSPATRKSPLAKCRELSNPVEEWERMFESLKKEKKQVRYKALKTGGWGSISQMSSKDFNVCISKVGRVAGEKGAVIFKAFRYN